jgi:hypothetical protein
MLSHGLLALTLASSLAAAETATRQPPSPAAPRFYVFTTASTAGGPPT